MRFAASMQKAFTLVELMVVMTVIAIVTSVMVLEMGGTYEDALLRTNARKLIDVCDSASNQAVATHQAQTLRIDAKSGRFSVQPKAQALNESDAVIVQGELDPRIALVIREPQRNEESDSSNDGEAAETPAQ